MIEKATSSANIQSMLQTLRLTRARRPAVSPDWAATAPKKQASPTP